MLMLPPCVKHCKTVACCFPFRSKGIEEAGKICSLYCPVDSSFMVLQCRSTKVYLLWPDAADKKELNCPLSCSKIVHKSPRSFAHIKVIYNLVNYLKKKKKYLKPLNKRSRNSIILQNVLWIMSSIFRDVPWRCKKDLPERKLFWAICWILSSFIDLLAQYSWGSKRSKGKIVVVSVLQDLFYGSEAT